MATAAVTNVFANDTVMESAKVNENFQDLVDFIDTEVIHRDGEVAFTGNVEEPFMPTDDDHLTKRGYVDANITNTGIPKATVDAAGDLLVASADNTLARLAKGSDDDVLLVDSGSVAWGPTPILPANLAITHGGELHIVRSNEYIHVFGNFHNGEPAATPQNVMNKIRFTGPFYVTSSVSIDGIGCYITNTGVNVRAAVYKGHPTTGAPDTLVVESASTPSVSGVNTIPIATTELVPGNPYWLALNVDSNTWQTYSYTFSMGVGYGSFGAGATTPYVGNTLNKYMQDHTYGAFPATATPVVFGYSEAPAGVPMLSILIA